MTARRRFGLAAVGLFLLLVAFSGWMASGKRPPEVEPDAFAQAVDLEPFSNLAVHTDGRLKSFGSFSHEVMGWVLGPRTYQGQAPAFTYLDMLFRPDAYARADVIFVKHKLLRAQIRAAIESLPPRGDAIRLRERLDDFVAWGLVSEDLLALPAVESRLQELRADVMRSEKFVSALDGARSVKSPGSLFGRLVMVPPPGTDLNRPWKTFGDEGVSADVTADFRSLQTAWQARDAPAVNAALATLAATLPGVNPVLYPDHARLSWESWYFEHGGLTWVWTVYLAAIVLLLLALVYRWRPARIAGLSVFGLAFGLHSVALGLRWYVSGRWPNSNMFEAVTTSAWMGGLAAIVFEIVGRRTALRNLFALTSATAGMVALMSAHFLPLELNANIGNKMPVLHDVWLYIHTNVIIWSYILIFMAAVSGLLYLLYRMCGGEKGYVTAGGGLVALSKGGMGGGGSGGGGSGGGRPGLEDSRIAPVLDGVTMDLMKLSFVMLWAGLVMGAIWADHSWGRPWGWDPKEVFALNTFLIFLLLVHVRFRAKDKGFWTALLAVLGAGVMLFNWIVINFLITGLHSYA